MMTLYKGSRAMVQVRVVGMPWALLTGAGQFPGGLFCFTGLTPHLWRTCDPPEATVLFESRRLFLPGEILYPNAPMLLTEGPLTYESHQVTVSLAA